MPRGVPARGGREGWKTPLWEAFSRFSPPFVGKILVFLFFGLFAPPLPPLGQIDHAAISINSTRGRRKGVATEKGQRCRHGSPKISQWKGAWSNSRRTLRLPDRTYRLPGRTYRIGDDSPIASHADAGRSKICSSSTHPCGEYESISTPSPVLAKYVHQTPPVPTQNRPHRTLILLSSQHPTLQGSSNIPLSPASTVPPSTRRLLASRARPPDSPNRPWASPTMVRPSITARNR